MHDRVYAHPHPTVSPFEFDEAVVDVFPDMIGRSVPGYDLTLPVIGLLAARYAQPHSRIYDLGSSLGACLLAMRSRITQPGVTLIGEDNSPAMIKRCRELVAADPHEAKVTLVESDLQEVEIENASMVVLNFTLQFLPVGQRPTLIQRIFNGLLPGGVLVLSEKIVFSDPDQNQRFIDIHHDFKRDNGYTDLEVSQKRKALENVLVPETAADHCRRIQGAGFGTCEQWFQGINFISLLAIKN